MLKIYLIKYVYVGIYACWREGVALLFLAT